MELTIFVWRNLNFRKLHEILVKVISDSICMSTYKCAILGTEHKRVHEDVAEHPAIMGHEFAGDIIKV